MPVQGITRWRDLDLMFTKHPVTRDVAVKTGEQAIIQALKTLVLTSFYERPFHPEVGSAVRQQLFENITPLTAQYIKQSIWDVIRNFEKRVSLRDVSVIADPDRNGINVSIEFYIVNQSEPIQISFFLERIR